MSKSSEDFKFILHFKYNDLAIKIKDKLKKIDPEWMKDLSRQETYDMHKNTNSIFIYEYDNSWNPGEGYELKHRSEDKELLDLVIPIIEDLEKLHNGRVAKTLFIKLPPFKDVLPHVDNGPYLETVRRHHIPIITNPKVSFVIDGERRFMDVGECWEVNNNKRHQVWNEGGSDRIHLLIDIIPNRFIKGETNV